jgi:predicted MPP superfamily phosphohydrolase
MTKIMTLLLALGMVLLDCMAYRKLKRCGWSKKKLYTFVGVILSSYLLIVLTPLFMYIFIDAENSQWMMKFSMFILTVYLFFSVSRIVTYLFWLPTRKKKWMSTGVAAGSLLLIFFLYSALVTRTDYKVNELDMTFSNVPTGFDGYKIAFISDIHLGSMWNAENELEELSGIISDINPDLLVFGGDVVNIHHSELTPEILALLSRIKGKDGSYAVLGNHDTGAYINGSTAELRAKNIEMVRSKLENAGWLLLQDSTVYLKMGNDSIAVTGIDYSDELLEYKHSLSSIRGYDVGRVYKTVPDNIFNITVSHLPQLWYSLCDGGYSDLTLSGHIHSMQFKLFSCSPAMLMYDEWSGLYEREKGKLYINDGIGSVGFFARVGANPEITVITLDRQ